MKNKELKRKFSKLSSLLLLGAATFIFCVLPVHAQTETDTAGSSLKQEADSGQAAASSSERAALGGQWLKINGQWTYFDSSGNKVNNNTHEKGSLKGIDVSKWQGDINWTSVKNYGIDFAFIRLGYGQSGVQRIDPLYTQNIKNANTVGIPVGVYFYSTAQNTAQSLKDAQFVIQNMRGYTVSYPVVLDLEDASQTNLTKTQIGQIAAAFCNEVKAAGYTPMIYCNEDWALNYIDWNQIADVDRWIARYNVTYNPSIEREIWQCSCRGRVDGISEDVDIDFGYKDYTKYITPRTEPDEDYGSAEKGVWIQDSHGWWYRYPDGSYPKNTWEQIKGVWYWFDPSGYRVTGWRAINGSWYYFNTSGAMQTGWLNLNGVKYYLSSSGSMLTGLQTINGKTYLFSSSGNMKTGWGASGGYWYYFNSSGVMQTGWIKDAGVWYYLRPDGRMVKGMTDIDGYRYYMNNSGMMQTGWLKLDGSWYYFDQWGPMKTGWAQIDGYWYYFTSDGQMTSGWQMIGGSWYYMEYYGVMKTGWLYDGGCWYYLNTSGRMLTGWQKIGSSTYYFFSNGTMAVGTRTINGTTYNFGSDGRLR